jgi:hypothetical protein
MNENSIVAKYIPDNICDMITTKYYAKILREVVFCEMLSLASCHRKQFMLLAIECSVFSPVACLNLMPKLIYLMFLREPFQQPLRFLGHQIYVRFHRCRLD